MLYGDDTQLRIKVGNHLLIYETWWRGDLHKAQILLATLQPLVQGPGVQPLGVVTMHAMAAGYSWMVAENDQAIEYAHKGLEVAEQAGVHAWDMLLCSQGVFGSLSAGRRPDTEQFLQRMKRLLDSRRLINAAFYYYQHAWYELIRGDVSKAALLVKTAFDIGVKCGFSLFIPVCRNDLARIHFYTGNDPLGWQELQQAREEGRSFGASTVEYLTWLLEAEVHLRDGNVADCAHALQRCFGIGRENNIRNHTWWDARKMRELYAVALEHEVEPDYVCSVIKQRQLAPDETCMHLEKWPRPVKLYTLGGFRLLIDVEPIADTGKAQIRPLSLLKALLALGGRDVPQDQLCDALWPDSEGDAARRTLHSNVFRARRLLGYEDALVVREERVGLDPRFCWTDTWALEREMKKLGDAGETDTKTVDQLLGLYRGVFLPGDDEPWAIGFREHIRGRLARRLTGVFHRLEDSGDYAAIAGICERALEADPLAEIFYQELINAHQAQGQYEEAIAACRQCEALFAQQLGRGPSEATTRLYQSALDEQTGAD